MPAPVPNFVRRAWRLIEARRALLEGVPERALEHLSDPVLSLSGEADRLRERSLSALYRHAARRAKEGRSQSVARVLEVVAGAPTLPPLERGTNCRLHSWARAGSSPATTSSTRATDWLRPSFARRAA